MPRIYGPVRPESNKAMAPIAETKTAAPKPPKTDEQKKGDDGK